MFIYSRGGWRQIRWHRDLAAVFCAYRRIIGLGKLKRAAETTEKDGILQSAFMLTRERPKVYRDAWVLGLYNGGRNV